MKGDQGLCGCCGGGGMCSCGWHHGHMIFRIILGVIFVMLVFWFGVKLGELREISFGYGGNDGGYRYGMQMPMMRYYYAANPGSPVPQGTPAAGTSTASPSATK